MPEVDYYVLVRIARILFTGNVSISAHSARRHDNKLHIPDNWHLLRENEEIRPILLFYDGQTVMQHWKLLTPDATSRRFPRNDEVNTAFVRLPDVVQLKPGSHQTVLELFARKDLYERH